MNYEIGKKYRHKITGETGVCVGFGTFIEGQQVLIDVVKANGDHDRNWMPVIIVEEVAS